MPGNRQSDRLLSPAPLTVDWAAQEEEWRHHLTTALANEVELRSFGSRLHRPPQTTSVYYELRADSFPPVGRLRLYPAPDGVFAVAPAETDHISLAVWQRAITEACERVGTSSEEFPWIAWVGDDMRTVLTRGIQVGPMEIASPAEIFVEAVPLSVPSFGGSISWSYPLEVRGVASGVSWDTATSQAGEKLYRLCAVLSVALKSRWTVKQFAHPLVLGDITAPTRAALVPEDVCSGLENADRHEVEPPQWLGDAAWDLAGEDWIAGPLSAHYRALQLEDTDPTTALTLLVASIEGIGARYIELERCDCGKSQVGARARFRHALSLIFDKEQVKASVKFYDDRSGAAHGDLITGQPLTADPIARVGWFFSSDEYELKRKVTDVRRASSQLLATALQGELPEPVVEEVSG